VPTALLVATSLLGSACSTSEDFEQVDAIDYERNVAMPTTTIVVGTLPSTAPPTTTDQLPGSPVPAGAEGPLAALVGQLVANPDLIGAIGQLNDPNPAVLAGLLGLDPSIIAQLGMTLAEIQGLAAVVAGIDPESLARAFGEGLGRSIDTSAVNELARVASRVDGTAIAAVDGLTRQVVGALATAVSQATRRADPAILAVLTALLDRLVPALGALATNPTNAAVLAVFGGATLRANPGASTQVATQFAGDPEMSMVISHLDELGRTLDPAQANALAAIAPRMTPEALTAFTALIEVLGEPMRSVLQS
jgi:hypothetical protein